MATTTTASELRKMPLEDLLKEIREHQQILAKMRMAVRVGSEKNSAKYQNERKEIARMQTIATEKRYEQSIKNSQKPSNTSAS